MSLHRNVGIILVVVCLVLVGFWLLLPCRGRSPIPGESVSDISIRYRDGSNLTIEPTSPHGQEILHLSARLLCRLYAQMRTGTMSPEETAELRSQTTHLDILLKQDSRVFVRCQTGRSGWIETRRLLIVLSHPKENGGYKGWVILHRYEQTEEGLSGGFFKADLEHQAGWRALEELEDLAYMLILSGL